MKKICIGLSFLGIVLATTGCGIFKKKCDCPKFEAHSDIKKQ